KVEGGGGTKQRARGAGHGDGFRLAQTIAARRSGILLQGASFSRGRGQRHQARGNDQNAEQTSRHTFSPLCDFAHGGRGYGAPITAKARSAPTDGEPHPGWPRRAFSTGIYGLNKIMLRENGES